ncbi:hypothetical protein PCL_09696 [Purpureocillium lilacinum]|uniref:Uncharacterized protein n=1 Tax=Purpureocillium lilacinum TaxID=33203 RepID=A0A2U3EDT2_PURLI|nr:hypothetical protein PCL_09696 [Purpureocillium lilacinum]
MESHRWGETGAAKPAFCDLHQPFGRSDPAQSAKEDPIGLVFHHDATTPGCSLPMPARSERQCSPSELVFRFSVSRIVVVVALSTNWTLAKNTSSDTALLAMIHDMARQRAAVIRVDDCRVAPIGATRSPRRNVRAPNRRAEMARVSPRVRAGPRISAPGGWAGEPMAAYELGPVMDVG